MYNMYAFRIWLLLLFYFCAVFIRTLFYLIVFLCFSTQRTFDVIVE